MENNKLANPEWTPFTRYEHTFYEYTDDNIRKVENLVEELKSLCNKEIAVLTDYEDQLERHATELQQKRDNLEDASQEEYSAADDEFEEADARHKGVQSALDYLNQVASSLF